MWLSEMLFADPSPHGAGAFPRSKEVDYDAIARSVAADRAARAERPAPQRKEARVYALAGLLAGIATSEGVCVALKLYATDREIPAGPGGIVLEPEENAALTRHIQSQMDAGRWRG